MRLYWTMFKTLWNIFGWGFIQLATRSIIIVCQANVDPRFAPKTSFSRVATEDPTQQLGVVVHAMCVLKAFSKLELHIPTKDLVASRVAQYISVIRYLWYSREQYDDESFRKIIDWEKQFCSNVVVAVSAVIVVENVKAAYSCTLVGLGCCVWVCEKL